MYCTVGASVILESDFIQTKCPEMEVILTPTLQFSAAHCLALLHIFNLYPIFMLLWVISLLACVMLVSSPYRHVSHIIHLYFVPTLILDQHRPIHQQLVQAFFGTVSNGLLLPYWFS